MRWIHDGLYLLIAYLLGSIPIGLFVVRAYTGKDIRQEHSGRTGGTNVLRVAGLGPGLLTVIGDFGKAVLAVHLAGKSLLNPDWLQVIAGIFVILGHNYSLFLLERVDGRWRMRGGAGGISTMGAAAALWPGTILVTLPLGAGLLYGLGYASVGTMSIALSASIIFLVRALLGHGPWAFLAFGIMAELLLLWELRPNIKRLASGTERMVGWRARRRKKGSKPNHQIHDGAAS